jgi:single-stranded-DNA-specific exonuclease
MGLLDLVALATICDVVPLERLNRAFVARGLDVMKARQNAGLRALANAAGLNQPPTPYVLGFVLGPRINAGGRIGDAGLGARLLTVDDDAEADRIAQLLDRLNRERKAIETDMLANAAAQADVVIDADPDVPLLMLGSTQWHKGVVGLVASRLTERHRRPTCVIAWEGTEGKSGGPPTGTASLRSIAGVDIGRAVRAAVDRGLLVKGGGHAMAAGLTVEKTRFDELQAFLVTELRKATGDARLRAALEIDGSLTPGAVNDETIDLLEKAGPYGQGNPQPRFAFPAHRVKFAKIVGENHVRCVLEASDGSRLDAVAFRAAGQPIGEALLAAGGLPMHVAGCLKRDTWGGRQKIELLIDDVADPRRCGR